MSELKFKPLTEGLGFHPFSDGLPYAPVSQTQANTRGSGAVSAGPPRFAATPRVSVPVARPAAPRVVPAPAPARAPAPVALLPTPGWIYLLKRVLAYGFDTVVHLGLGGAGILLIISKQQLSPEILYSPGFLLVTAVFAVAFNWALITAQEVAFHTTLGKRLFGLALPGNAIAIFLRAFFFLPSALFCGVGLLWAAFDGRSRCWHDVVVDLQPIER